MTQGGRESNRVGNDGRLRVLLFSAVRGVDPASGDVAYTEALLTDPPPGVEYVLYPDAVASGAVQVRGRSPRKTHAAVDFGLFAVRAAERLLRTCRLMYREPVWFVTIEDGAFDLVHQHVFAVSQIGSCLPVVSSAGYPLSELYRKRDGWSGTRLAVATALERAYAGLFDVHNPWLRSSRGQPMTVYTEYFRDWLVHHRVPSEIVSVCGTALPDLGLGEKRLTGPVTLGFVGRNFKAKGGEAVVAAHAALRSRYPGLRLLVLTGSTSEAEIPSTGDGVEVLFDVPREQILRRYLPEIDIFVLPTGADCGVPYAMLEALQSAACVVTSHLPWLDERLQSPAVTRTGVDQESVRDAVEELLEPSVLRAAQASARALWQERFSPASLHVPLLDAYGRAVAIQGRRGRAAVAAGGTR